MWTVKSEVFENNNVCIRINVDLALEIDGDN